MKDNIMKDNTIINTDARIELEEGIFILISEIAVVKAIKKSEYDDIDYLYRMPKKMKNLKIIFKLKFS